MKEKRHLIIIGFMGTGKTTVGRELANRMNLPWVDTDRYLEERWGFAISEYFRKFGEPAFREQETEILKEILQGPPSLITTGGGIVLRPENRMMMQRQGWVVHLYAHPDEIIRRVSGDGNQERPLIQGDVREKVWRLFREREGKYDFADLKLDTTSCTVNQAVEQILAFWHKNTFNS
ncbi:shikimate kinase [Lihuaxuella thermophila]|uniref:Shikimate kinase n=1 Tax=Lihuaxuella thermophila TaxID=1173111 RepID=A0A1H8DHB6_9BACL|nr:shikimate kinase [Lihuaxuella thermophila]SEN06565.1 shikimate kinase [Lihuaxuella thermophila]